MYLPGGRWRGYDPTHNLAVGDRHVSVAAGASSTDAAPVTGAFRSLEVSSRLEVEVEVHALEGSEQ